MKSARFHEIHWIPSWNPPDFMISSRFHEICRISWNLQDFMAMKSADSTMKSSRFHEIWWISCQMSQGPMVLFFTFLLLFRIFFAGFQGLKCLLWLKFLGFFLLFYRFCESIVSNKSLRILYCSNLFTQWCGTCKGHVICMSVEKHLILAVTSLNSKTKGSNLYIYYTLY